MNNIHPCLAPLAPCLLLWLPWLLVFSCSGPLAPCVLQDNFLFTCECEACESCWPTYSKLPVDPPSQKVRPTG